MGNRLSKITTRTGDKGETGLAGGERVAKDDAIIEAIGTVDELNSQLGLVIATLKEEDLVGATLLDIQHHLFDLGGELAMGEPVMGERSITELEESVEMINRQLPPLKEFILPGGNLEAAQLHVARTICRRAERCVVSAAKEHQITDTARIYLNRLSDYLFVAARLIARRSSKEVLWQRDRND